MKGKKRSVWLPATPSRQQQNTTTRAVNKALGRDSDEQRGPEMEQMYESEEKPPLTTNEQIMRKLADTLVERNDAEMTLYKARLTRIDMVTQTPPPPAACKMATDPLPVPPPPTMRGVTTGPMPWKPPQKTYAEAACKIQATQALTQAYNRKGRATPKQCRYHPAPPLYRHSTHAHSKNSLPPQSRTSSGIKGCTQ